jgi:hypothetical protein
MMLFFLDLAPKHWHFPASLHGARNPEHHHLPHRCENLKSLIGAAQSVNTGFHSGNISVSALDESQRGASVSVVGVAFRCGSRNIVSVYLLRFMYTEFTCRIKLTNDCHLMHC